MGGKDEAAIPVGVARSNPARGRVPDGVSPAPVGLQQGIAVRIPPTKPVTAKPWVPKIWIACAALGLLTLLVPSIVTFLINLRPGDHSDNGDGLYWLPGLLLLPCLLFGIPTVFLAFCVGIGEWVAWVRTARQQNELSVRMLIIPPVVHRRLLLCRQILCGYSVRSWHLAKLPDVTSVRRLVGAFVAAVLAPLPLHYGGGAETISTSPEWNGGS